MHRLTVGTVTAHYTPEDVEIKTDDRQELVKTVTYSGGSFAASVAVVDGGYSSSGQVDSYSGVKIKSADWSTFYGYWTARTLVSVTGLDGVTTNNCRIVLKSWKRNKNFTTVECDFEVWRS